MEWSKDGVLGMWDEFGYPLATTEEPSVPKRGLSLEVNAPRTLEAVTGLQLNKDTGISDVYFFSIVNLSLGIL